MSTDFVYRSHAGVVILQPAARQIACELILGQDDALTLVSDTENVPKAIGLEV